MASKFIGDGSQLTNVNAQTVDGIDSTGFVKQLSDTTNPNYQTPSSRRVDPNTGNPTNEHYAITTYGNGGNVTGQLATHFQTGATYNRAYNNSWSAWERMFDDSYHPNADKWTTPRTLSLTGDVTGSTSWDGSGNASINAIVANDSHTHDTQYQASNGLHKRFTTNNSNVGERYYKIGTHYGGNGFVQMIGTIGSHVESFNTSRFSVTMFVRENGASGEVSVDGTFEVANDGSGIIIVRTTNDGSYENYEIWLKVPNYAQVVVDVDHIGLTYDGNTYTTSTPSGYATEIDTTGYTEGHYVISASQIIARITSAGITSVGDVTAYSDARLKTDVANIDGALDKVSQLNGVTFTRTTDNKRSTGVIAQEVLAVLPEAVNEDEEGFYSVKYGNIVGLLVEAIKEQNARIQELENKLNGK